MTGEDAITSDIESFRTSFDEDKNFLREKNFNVSRKFNQFTLLGSLQTPCFVIDFFSAKGYLIL